MLRLNGGLETRQELIGTVVHRELVVFLKSICPFSV